MSTLASYTQGTYLFCLCPKKLTVTRYSNRYLPILNDLFIPKFDNFGCLANKINFILKIRKQKQHAEIQIRKEPW